MYKKTKIFIFSFLFFISILFFQATCFAKYMIEDIQTVATLDIDGGKPTVEILDITSTNDFYPSRARKCHLISGHLKITERNLTRNDLTIEHLKIVVGKRPYLSEKDITPVDFKSFSLISETPLEKIYEFSFTNVEGFGTLGFIIPEGILEDKYGFINERLLLPSNLVIDNTPPLALFDELPSSDGKTIGRIRLSESVKPIEGWKESTSGLVIEKEFSNPISYILPLEDYASNPIEVLIDIKNANAISLEYGTYDELSKQTLVSSGEITSPNTISSTSLAKTESIFLRAVDSSGISFLQGKVYMHTYLNNSTSFSCSYSHLPYYPHYNPSPTQWWNVGSDHTLSYFDRIFTQFGGYGCNHSDVIPSHISSQFLYGISSLQFKLKNLPNYSVVYQSYVKDIGWLPVSCDGEENFYQHDKPISSFRMNLIPSSQKQFLIDFWNRDIGTHSIN